MKRICFGTMFTILYQINVLGLNNYEFYFYVVPFNDATSERVSLIDEMIGGI